MSLLLLLLLLVSLLDKTSSFGLTDSGVVRDAVPVSQSQSLFVSVSEELQRQFDVTARTHSDVNLHMPLLFEHAKMCSSVLELGTGKNFRASWAFLRGLAESTSSSTIHNRVSNTKTETETDKTTVKGIDNTGIYKDRGSTSRLMVGLDVLSIPETVNITRIAAEHGIEYHFHQASDLELPIKELYGEFDLTFIDTWHCFGQLSRELALFHQITRKFIIMHDVNIDGVYGEDIRSGDDLSLSVARSNFTYGEVAVGLKPALSAFLAKHSEWKLTVLTEDIIGLAVLTRVNE